MLNTMTDNKNFEEMILKSIKSNSHVFVWDVVGTEIKRVPVKLKNYNSIKKTLNLAVDVRAKNYLKDFVNSSGLVKFFIPEQKVIFLSSISFYRGDNLEVKYPVNIEKHDRRKDTRLEPLFPVVCNIDGIKKECFDISMGGFSLVMNKMEVTKSKLKKDQDIECRIEFSINKTKVSATVVNISDIKPFELDRFPYGAKRVSFKVDENLDYRLSVEKVAKGMKKLMNDLL